MTRLIRVRAKSTASSVRCFIDALTSSQPDLQTWTCSCSLCPFSHLTERTRFNWGAESGDAVAFIACFRSDFTLWFHNVSNKTEVALEEKTGGDCWHRCMCTVQSVTTLIWCWVMSGELLHCVRANPGFICNPRPVVSGRLELVSTRVRINFHTCPNKMDYLRKQTLVRQLQKSLCQFVDFPLITHSFHWTSSLVWIFHPPFGK